jgi:hypothetical protein
MLNDSEKKISDKNLVLNGSGGFGMEKIKIPFVIISKEIKKVKNRLSK